MVALSGLMFAIRLFPATLGREAEDFGGGGETDVRGGGTGSVGGVGRGVWGVGSDQPIN